MTHIARIRIFLIGSLLFILLGLFIILLNDKTAIHLGINHQHYRFLDYFFTYATHLGDGLFAAIAVLLIGIFAFPTARAYVMVMGGTSLLFSGFIAQFLKRVIYPDAERPLKYIGEQLLYLVPDVEVHEMNSFPSGHTATAFAFFAFLAFITYKKPKFWQYIIVLVAVLVGYSRMYLSQHFLEDVVMGATVGIISFILAFSLVAIIPFKNRI